MTNTIAYTIPTIGATPDPAWEAYFNTALAAIQTHTHDGVNAGALLLPAALDLSAGGFNFLNQPQTNASYFDVAQQSSAPAQTSGHGRLYCDTSGNLYYISPTNNVLLASASSINYSSAAKGFLGDYGVTGGGCYFNTASASWPNSSTFFFYTSASTPANDSGSRAGLAAGFLSLKSTVSNALIRTVDSAAVTAEDFRFGYIGASSSKGEYGLRIFPDSTLTGSVLAGYAFSARETANSATLSPATSAAALSRTYQFCINDLVSVGAIADRALAVRKTTVNLSSSTPYPIGYYYALPVDLTGAAVAPATGYGIQWEWRLPSSVNLNTSTASQVVAYEECTWSNYAAHRGRFAHYLAINATTWLPAIEMLANSAGSFNIGIAAAAQAYGAGPGITLGAALYMGNNDINNVGTIGGVDCNFSNASFGTLLVGSGGITVGSGGACSFITGTFSGLLTASAGITGTYIVSTDTSGTGTNTNRNALNNTVAWATCSSSGVVARGYNITADSHPATGHFVYTIGNSVSTDAGIVATCTDSAARCIRAKVTGATTAEIWITRSTDSADFDAAHSFWIIGG